MVYLAPTGPGGATGTAASPLAFVSDWTINFTVAKVDVTALGDTNLVWVAGLPDASGDFTGFFDTATSQTYTAAIDGLSRNFYLYPSLLGSEGANPGQYFFEDHRVNCTRTWAPGASTDPAAGSCLRASPLPDTSICTPLAADSSSTGAEQPRSKRRRPVNAAASR